ncbi:hypothetical protein [Streptomyces sp. NPDC057302]|uniref:hypothetical protein n=1 Tax=Streptomyces sp. NPDC057302 TaxID=3346094 RepID=UPI003640A5E3
MLIPVLAADSAMSEDGDAAGAAVTAAGCLLLLILALPALLVLRSLRARGLRRSQLLSQWAAVDRGYDSEFPSGYGSQGSPHSRFFNAALVLTLAFILAVVVLANAADANTLVLLPGLVVAAGFSWATVRKYAIRYGWAAREMAIRGRERRRHQLRERMSGAVEAQFQMPGIRPALLYVALCVPVAIVAVIFAIARPRDVLGLLLIGLLALAVMVIGLPMAVLRRRRERTRLVGAATALADSFDAGIVVHPMRYGFGDPVGRRPADGPASWDSGPPRDGVVALGAGVLHLRGADGSALDLPSADLMGVAHLAATVSWLDPTLDLLLRSGESIEIRTANTKEIAESLSSAGVRTITG